MSGDKATKRAAKVRLAKYLVCKCGHTTLYPTRKLARRKGKALGTTVYRCNRRGAMSGDKATERAAKARLAKYLVCKCGHRGMLARRKGRIHRCNRR